MLAFRKLSETHWWVKDSVVIHEFKEHGLLQSPHISRFFARGAYSRTSCRNLKSCVEDNDG